MNITLAAVGRLKTGPHLELFQQFTKRLPWSITVKEVEEKKPLPSAQLREREAELLLAALPKNTHLIALDEHGKEWSSKEFAAYLQRCQEQGDTSLAFAIGGADGHGEALLKQAKLKLSLGKMTWPHMLVRVMLAEQLYRAYTILNHHPYHRE